MAGTDYHSCDVCGGKSFYKGSLPYYWDEKTQSTKLEGVSSLAVVCDDCGEKDYRAVVCDQQGASPTTEIATLRHKLRLVMTALRRLYYGGPALIGTEGDEQDVCDHGIPLAQACDECWREAIAQILGDQI